MKKFNLKKVFPGNLKKNSKIGITKFKKFSILAGGGTALSDVRGELGRGGGTQTCVWIL